MSSMQIDSVLAQIRALQQQMKIGLRRRCEARRDSSGWRPWRRAGHGPQASFANVLKQGLDRVNETQGRLRTWRRNSNGAFRAWSSRR